MMKGPMDRCLAREKWVDRLKEKAEIAETELNELRAQKESQVKKLSMTKKALEELEILADKLRKVLQDKEGEISKLREQIRRAKEDEMTEFHNSDGFLTQLSDCYENSFQECLRQVKALYPNLDVSQVSLDNVAQTPARTVDHEGTDEILEADPIPNVQGDGEAPHEDEQVKSVGDENHPIRKEDGPAKHEKVVNEDTPVNQPQCFL